jgi:hypothetical protein
MADASQPQLQNLTPALANHDTPLTRERSLPFSHTLGIRPHRTGYRLAGRRHL